MDRINSISIRLRRTTTEVAHVSVPITDVLLVPDSEDPTVRRLDVDKLSQAALALGVQDNTDWQLEGEAIVELHPIQQGPADVSA
jgi:hypothetical protein